MKDQTSFNFQDEMNIPYQHSPTLNEKTPWTPFLKCQPFSSSELLLSQSVFKVLETVLFNLKITPIPVTKEDYY